MIFIKILRKNKIWKENKTHLVTDLKLIYRIKQLRLTSFLEKTDILDTNQILRQIGQEVPELWSQIQTNKQTDITASISTFKVNLCLFVYLNVRSSHENLDQFDSNFVWGARDNHGKNP